MSRHTEALTGYKNRLIGRIKNLDPGLATELDSLRLGWYSITNAADDESTVEPDEEPAASVYIYDEIGGSFGVSADEFVQELNGITARQIDVHINSPGGSLFDAIAIYNALVMHPANITTYVDSLAASAASIVALAGDEVVTMVGAQWMIHDAMGMEFGNAADMEAMAAFLNRQSDNIASIYANKAGGDIEDWRAKMLAETWMMAPEAVALGLSDRVYEPRPKGEEEEPKEPEVEMPDEDEMMPDEEESTEDAEEGEDDEEIDVKQLMRKRHVLTGRGFKYAGVQAYNRKLALANRKTSTVDPVSRYLAKIGK